MSSWSKLRLRISDFSIQRCCGGENRHLPQGTNSFSQGRAAVAHGAIATIVYNNEPGVINMDLSDYQIRPPACPSLRRTEPDPGCLHSATAASGARYYTGTITIGGKATSAASDLEYYTMSDFSSWGVPGDLSLKPRKSRRLATSTPSTACT